MIHTFELQWMIANHKNASRLARDLFDGDLNNGLASCQFHEDYPGLHEITMRHLGEEYYTVTLAVEPQALIENNYTISLFDASAMSKRELQRAFSSAIDEIADRALPRDMNRWYTKRIDYAMNLHCNHVERYIQLAKKGRDPYRYEEKRNWAGSSYRQCKSTRLNYYDKADQVSKSYGHMPKVQLQLLQEAEGVLRIEIQCREYSKLQNLKKKHRLPDMKISSFLDPKVASQVIQGYYEKVIGYGDYYSLSEAWKLIESTSWRRNKKNNIYNWLRLIAQARSISKAREQFVQGTRLKNTGITVQGSQNTFRNYVRACQSINLNPVTIPRKWKVSSMQNPFRV